MTQVLLNKCVCHKHSNMYKKWGLFCCKGLFIFIFWHRITDLINNLLVKTPSQAQWQMATKKFIYMSLGLNPLPFKSHDPRRGYTSEPSPQGP